MRRVAAHVVKEFGLRLDQLHNDSTTVSFYGAYLSAALEKQVFGRPTLAMTFGHSKDHRPDLKQLLFILTVTADGGAMFTRFTNEKGTAVEYTGWLPASRCMISTGRGPLGDSFELRFFEITDEHLRGSIFGTTEEGDDFEGMLLIKLHGPDRYTMKRDLLIDGQWQTWTGEVRRKK